MSCFSVDWRMHPRVIPKGYSSPPARMVRRSGGELETLVEAIRDAHRRAGFLRRLAKKPYSLHRACPNLTLANHSPKAENPCLTLPWRTKPNQARSGLSSQTKIPSLAHHTRPDRS